jgi:hypothetical protein
MKCEECILHFDWNPRGSIIGCRIKKMSGATLGEVKPDDDCSEEQDRINFLLEQAEGKLVKA